MLRGVLGVWLGILVTLATCAILFAAGGFYVLSREFKSPVSIHDPVFFEVAKGDGLMTIAGKLSSSGIMSMKQEYAFILFTRLQKAQGALKAGEYELTAGMTPDDILGKMKNGEVFVRRFTVPEGLTSYEIVRILDGVPELAGSIAATPAEGTLLPETYDYSRGEERGAVVQRMQAAMTDALNALWSKRAENLPVKTPEEALVLASIVEKETGRPEERKRVAGVFVNRLKAAMPLQTDPTVIYALTEGRPESAGQGPLGRRLLAKDLEIDSPYNTYKYPGLPPGPIANPGRQSLEAALQPEIHDYLYFVADGTGGHVFAKTLEEHNANVRKWRAIRKILSQKTQESK